MIIMVQTSKVQAFWTDSICITSLDILLLNDGFYCSDRLGKKVRVKCNPDDTVGDLKKLIAAQIGTRSEKIVLKKWYE
jgi:hypothetical protein